MFGDKTQPKWLSIKGPKGQDIPKGKINLEYFVTEQEFIEMYYKEKLTYRQIADRIDYPYDLSNLSRMVRRLGWKTFDPKQNALDLSVLNNYSDATAWILGWYATDGHINHKSAELTLQTRDVDVLVKMKNLFGYSGKIYDYDTKQVLRINSMEIVKAFNSLGIPSGNKTFTLGKPNIPEIYARDFMRGVFEGDGSVNTTGGNLAVTIVGAAPVFMEYLTDILDEAGIEYYERTQKEGRVKLIIMRGQYNSLLFLDWIYRDVPEEMRMSRKYGAFRTFLVNYYKRNRKCLKTIELVRSIRPYYVH